MSVVATPVLSSAGNQNRSRVASGASLGGARKSLTASTARQSRVTFPQSASSHDVTRDEGGDSPTSNPFLMPGDADVFIIRDKERQRAKKERASLGKLKVHEKLTYTAKVNTKAAAKRREAMQELKDEVDKELGEGEKDHTLAVAKQISFEKESLPEYISKKREMFLVQYSLGVKRDEMRKLEMVALAEERKLEQAEKYLEQDAQQFDEFLQENDKNSVAAIKLAEAEQREKAATQEEIRRTAARIAALRSEISKQEELLKEYVMYKQFLHKLTPSEWLEQAAREHPGEVKLYFTEPRQLLEMFAELEEQNLTLIQNSQETEETLEELALHQSQTMARMNHETDALQAQIEALQAQIEEEEERARDLQLRARMFNVGDYKEEDQEQMLADLHTKVEAVYRNCIGENEANLNTLAMLTAVENRLEELFQQIETMPADKVAAAERAKEMERRVKAREMKIEQQKRHQEERTRKALQRANEEPKKQTGKRLVFRSEPPETEKRDDEGDAEAGREEEEMRYFFSW